MPELRVRPLPDGAVLTDPDLLRGAPARRGRPVPAGDARRGGPARARPARWSRWCEAAARHGVPVVPQGARTGLAGAANAVDGAVVLSH